MTEGRPISETRALPAAGGVLPARAAKPWANRPVQYGALLSMLALALCLAILTLPPRATPFAIAGAGGVAAMLLGLLVRGECRGARAHRSPSPGRILESRQEEGHVLLVLPALTLEPWRADAWVIAAFAACAAGLGSSSLGRAAGFLLSFVLLLLGLRLFDALKASFRIELEPGRWAVEAVIGKRVLRRAGRGGLLPELTPEALFLWSDSGRVAVLRWELEPSERQWLGDRLTRYLETENSAAIAQHRDEVNRAETQQHG